MKTDQTEKEKAREKDKGSFQEEMTKSELDAVTTVFRSYETGLREATILPKALGYTGHIRQFEKLSVQLPTLAV